jgi:hypothetical protein
MTDPSEMSLLTPARKNVFAARPKVQRLTQKVQEYVFRDTATGRHNQSRHAGQSYFHVT